MATGADDDYWAEPNLPSMFKHTLLDKYVPQFAGMTGSRSSQRRVVLLDGYAGRGRYGNGNPGSAERIMMMAQQFTKAALAWTCFFVEQDEESAAVLATVVAEYVAKGVDARAHAGDVSDILDGVLRAAQGLPLFLFLDPTGLGLPYDVLVRLLTEKRLDPWPPTELLLNFSLEAVRRIGGHVRSPHGNEATMHRLDLAVNGAWWRALFTTGVTDEAVAEVVERFSTSLGNDTGMDIVSVPVARAPTHKPLYHLVFGTRSTHGLWAFGDSVARASQAWWDTLEEVEANEDPDTLFSVTGTIRPSLDTVEADAVPAIAGNLAAILKDKPSFKTVDETRRVFGAYYGQVREQTVRSAVKLLYAAGGTGCNGVGGKPRDLIVTRPQTAIGSRSGISS
jgi:three-Cys-motif partner protein